MKQTGLSGWVCLRAVCWDVLRGAAATAAVFHTLSAFQLNENNEATHHMTVPPFSKRHLHSLFQQQSIW